MKSKDSAKNHRRGYLYVVLAAFMWGLSGSSAKFLFNSGITPFQLVQLRLTISTVLLFLYLLIRFPSLLKISRSDIFYFVLFGTVGMAGVQFTYLFAISKIKVAAAILLQYLAPSFIALHSVVFMREKLSRVNPDSPYRRYIRLLSGCRSLQFRDSFHEYSWNHQRPFIGGNFRLVCYSR